MLPTRIRFAHNPYADTIPDPQFEALVTACVQRRAADIIERFESGEYSRDKIAFVVLDPTAPQFRETDDCILFVAIVGEAEFFAPNAYAKVAARRDHGVGDGELVYAHPHRLADGSFRFGYSVNVDGTLVGASGQTEIQDRYQATVLAADLNYQLTATRQEWARDFVGERWYAAEQVAPARFRTVIENLLG